MRLREWFSSLTPAEQDMLLAMAAGAYGVAVTYALGKLFREGDRKPIQVISLLTSLTLLFL